MVDLATKVLKDTLKLKVPAPDDKNFVKIHQLRMVAAQSIMTTATRVQSALLRPAQADEMDEVLAVMRSARGNDEEPETEESIDIFG